MLLMPSLAVAQDFDIGFSAAQAGDFATAILEWKPLAERGDVRAQYELGTMYRYGWALPQDYAEAVRWYRLAAEQGSVEAQRTLGALSKLGEGVPQNYAEAARWYRLAAEQGNVVAQSNLGNMYRFGEGVPQDYVAAHMWFNIMAANFSQGDAAERRDEVAALMTPSGIMEAQRRARACIESGYQDCD